MNSTKSRVLFEAGAVALVLCLGAPAAARADEPADLFEGGADLLAQARELWVEGTKAAGHGQWERARLFYLGAWRAQHHWQIAGSLGHAEAALGRHRDAAEHLTIFLRETADLEGVAPRDRAILAQELERARARSGAVTVSVQPAGAEVLVDGAPVGKAPLADPVFVEPGRHVIDARLEGYQASSEAQVATQGGAAQITLRLTPIAAPRAGIAPPPPAPRTPAPPPPTRARASTAIIIGGAVTSAVALGVGAGLTGWWAHLERDGACLKDSDPAPCEHTWASAKTASVWTLVGAGVLGAGTLTYALVTPKLGRKVKVSASTGPGGAAASMSLSW